MYSRLASKITKLVEDDLKFLNLLPRSSNPKLGLDSTTQMILNNFFFKCDIVSRVTKWREPRRIDLSRDVSF